MRQAKASGEVILTEVFLFGYCRMKLFAHRSKLNFESHHFDGIIKYHPQ
jgi:hypothetical protein